MFPLDGRRSIAAYPFWGHWIMGLVGGCGNLQKRLDKLVRNLADDDEQLSLSGHTTARSHLECAIG